MLKVLPPLHSQKQKSAVSALGSESHFPSSSSPDLVGHRQASVGGLSSRAISLCSDSQTSVDTLMERVGTCPQPLPAFPIRLFFLALSSFQQDATSGCTKRGCIDP